MHGFQNNLAQVFSLKSRSAIGNLETFVHLYTLTASPSPPPPRKLFFLYVLFFPIWILSPLTPPPPQNFFLIWILCQVVKHIFFVFAELDSLSNNSLTQCPPPPVPKPSRSDFESLSVCQKNSLPPAPNQNFRNLIYIFFGHS